jgi:ribose 5-phosphate isomerase
MTFELDLSQMVTAKEKAAAAKAEKIAAAQSSARAYLAQTDWYVTRLGETDTPIPADVVKNRNAARALLD